MATAHRSLRLGLAQVNPTVGDIDGNAALIAAALERARAERADLVVFPELALTGYPPEDLLFKRGFADAVEVALEGLARRAEGIVALVGAPLGAPRLRNSLAVLAAGRRVAAYEKVLLPNLGVFDERRYFEPGPGGRVIELGGIRVGLTVCEDIWAAGPPAATEVAAGASLIVNASASPYHRGKGAEREEMVAARAREHGVAVALCNLVGGQDELVFDGHSVIVDRDGQTLGRAAQFAEDLLIGELELPADSGEGPPGGTGSPAPPAPAPLAFLPLPEPERPPLPRSGSGPPPPLAPLEEVRAALILGLGDYARKNGFEHAVLGLSGGIDSALVAVLACEALGPGRVTGVVMPSPHSSPETQADAHRLAANLGCEALEIPIAGLMDAYAEALAPLLGDTEPGVTEENLQARIRGNLVMALSNKFGWLPLSTGNKSEMAVGYATLYGDMAGGFAVLKDVPKQLVFALTEEVNRRAGRELVPAAIITRPPSAELRPEQLDTDSLPPYSVLDPALEAYIEGDADRAALVAAGLEPELAERIATLVDRAEYKRRQAAPGVKITTKAFGRDRRLPITNRYRG